MFLTGENSALLNVNPVALSKGSLFRTQPGTDTMRLQFQQMGPVQSFLRARLPAGAHAELRRAVEILSEANRKLEMETYFTEAMPAGRPAAHLWRELKLERRPHLGLRSAAACRELDARVSSAEAADPAFRAKFDAAIALLKQVLPVDEHLYQPFSDAPIDLPGEARVVPEASWWLEYDPFYALYVLCAKIAEKGRASKEGPLLPEADIQQLAHIVASITSAVGLSSPEYVADPLYYYPEFDPDTDHLSKLQGEMPEVAEYVVTVRRGAADLLSPILYKRLMEEEERRYSDAVSQGGIEYD